MASSMREPEKNDTSDHNVESLTERMLKYKVNGDESLSSNGADDSPLFKNEADRLKHLHKIRASPTSSAASRISKNRSRSYEQLLTIKPEDASYEKLQIDNRSNSIPQPPISQPEKVHSSSAPVIELPPLVIPKDGNLQNFGVEEMAVFFRYMKINEDIVQRLHKKQLDGKRFGKLKDKTLEDLSMKNPIMLYFRDKSSKRKLDFML